MKKSTRSAALRQHARAKVSHPTQAAPLVTSQPIDVEVQPLLSVARFSVGPQTSPADLDEGADIIDDLAHDLAQAGSGGYGEQRIAEVCIAACARLLFTSQQYREIAKQMRQGGAP